MKADLLVYDVMEVFSDMFVSFPLNPTFNAVAEGLLTQPADTFSTFKECARQSVCLLPDNLSQAFNQSKAAAKAMQASRVAVRVFSILDLSAARKGINSSKDCSNEVWMRERAVLYDQNACSIRCIYGTIPLWQRNLPGLAMTYFRCAVKVAQRRFKQATANLTGADVQELFTKYEIGETAIELERMCDKLENHFRSLKSFVETSCIIPDSDPTNEEIEKRESFKDCMSRCRSLVLQFNAVMPILSVLNSNRKHSLRNGWKAQVVDNHEWTLQRVEEDEIDVEARYIDCTPCFSKSMIDNIRMLHSIATDGGTLHRDIGETQLACIATTELACFTSSNFQHR